MQGTAKGSGFPTVGAYSNVSSSDEEGVDDVVADHQWMPLTGEEESSE